MSDLDMQHFSLGWGRKRSRKFNRFLVEQVTLLREMFDRRPKVKPDHAMGGVQVVVCWAARLGVEGSTNQELLLTVGTAAWLAWLPRSC